MKQRLWPRHCVQDTWGSEIHKDLKVTYFYITLILCTIPVSFSFPFSFPPISRHRHLHLPKFVH